MMSFHEACVRLNAVVAYKGFKAVLFILYSPSIYVQTYNMIRRLPCYSHSEFFSELTAICLSCSNILSLQLVFGHLLASVSDSLQDLVSRPLSRLERYQPSSSRCYFFQYTPSAEDISPGQQHRAANSRHLGTALWLALGSRSLSGPVLPQHISIVS